jgi:predicted nucleotidyltransferase
MVPAAGYAAGMSELPDKLRAIRETVALFSESGVAYALIGGLAVGIRSGVPRATLDVDFAIPTQRARGPLVERFRELGFQVLGEFAHSLNLRHESGEPVQLAFDPEFDPMIERAELVQLGELQLRVVTKEDLIAMKRRAAADPARRRSKALRDQADIALLEGDVADENEGW